MRSLYVRIVLASSVTVLVSLAAFVVLTGRVVGRPVERLVHATYGLQIDQAVSALDTTGPAAVSALLRTLDARFALSHYMTDASGRDVVTGGDLSTILAATADRPDEAWHRYRDGFVYVQASADGRYRLLAVGTPPFTAWTFAPFYLLVLASIAVVSWWTAVGIASPLRTMAGTADRFGRGELHARVAYAGRNEIGSMAAAFNGMADRIETLVTAERRLLQDVSHELRSPLARLNVAAELARTAPDRDAAVDRFQRDLDRLGDLVGQLVEMTRAEGDPAARATLPVDLGALVTDIARTCAIEAQAKQCAIAIEAGSTRPVPGAAELLQRAVENVLRNAIRHAPAGSTIDVACRDGAAQTTISVRDRGPGVPDEELTRIFEPFHRLNSGDATTAGTGLGLAIARRAVAVHQGTVTAQNADPGLRVTVTIPHGT